MDKKEVTVIVISAVLLAVAYALSRILCADGWLKLALYLAPYIFVAFDVLAEAVKKLFRRELLAEDFLMSIASIGAIITGDFQEAVLVMLLFRLGELFEDVAVGKSRDYIKATVDLRPVSARLMENGSETLCKPDGISVGSIIRILPGERVPIDGTVVTGSAALDTSALTGEAMQKCVGAGDTVLSGSEVVDGVLEIKTSKPFSESTASAILALVESSSNAKSKSESFITRFARIYTPCVLCACVIIGFIPPLFSGNWTAWLRRAVTMLVVSCPCALVISVPLSFFGGLGAAARQGVLIKGSAFLEKLASVRQLAFDKTGTLTTGKFSVSNIITFGGADKNDVLNLAAAVEAFSVHPIAASIAEAGNGPLPHAEDITEKRGYGISATVEGRTVSVGNRRYFEGSGILMPEYRERGTVVFVAENRACIGVIELCDTIKPDTADALARLKALGIKRFTMLTGDNAYSAESVAERLGIDYCAHSLLPQDKVTQIEGLLKDGETAFVGDGINDAPVLARADIGIAMGALGSDAAIESADVVLMHDNLSALPGAIKIARKTKRIAFENTVFAIFVKVAVLILGALNITGMNAAVFADVGVMFIAVLNSLRTLKAKG